MSWVPPIAGRNKKEGERSLVRGAEWGEATMSRVHVEHPIRYFHPWLTRGVLSTQLLRTMLFQYSVLTPR